ncbi:DUF6223 family protein [Micromonospora tarensis]|uniref:Major facilitator superfamily (MFS) profile domain-containing protein n=1 Tax=Micromonospora tarensis TaxID=2806100 RepID=A0ABS1YAC1_9ACTN|nr:DUF6223 family protein [Micromonospora tarensis]MBM0274344.1 hypothetical protein [Micromonospora tarensis]
MSVRHLLVTAVAAPAAHASAQPHAAAALAMSSGRLGASSAVLLGLVGSVIGGLALARPAGRFGAGLGAGLALATGLIGMALGGLVVATSDGGVGTGNGRGGAFVALAVGLLGVVLGGLALVRARRLAA